MSVEAAVAFLDSVPQNEELQKKLVEILESAEDDRAEAAKLANDNGYDITPDELWAEVQKRQNEAKERQEAGELTDEELEAVAGGEFVVASAIFALTTAVAKLGYTAAKESKW